MSNDVAQVLSELRDDHRDMGALLQLLETEANRVYERQEPDFEVMGDIMQYMTVYPDAIHHPKEDRLYAEMRAVRPDLCAGMERISFDHRNIAEFGLKLRDDLSAVFSGGVVSRSSIVADALRYVSTLRDHMSWEERDLFRRIEQMCRDGHQVIEHELLPASADPVFGRNVADRYERLLCRIRDEVGMPR